MQFFARKSRLRNGVNIASIFTLIGFLLLYWQSYSHLNKADFVFHREACDAEFWNGEIIVSNEPEHLLLERKIQSRAANVESLVRRNQEIYRASRQLEGFAESWTSEELQREAELRGLELQHKQIVRQLKSMGYVPEWDIARMVVGLDRHIADDARDHVQINPILMQLGSKAIFRRSPPVGPPFAAFRYAIPVYPLGIVLCLQPALTFSRWMKMRSRRRRGLCVDCGYDLRQTPAKCPECGRDVHTRDARVTTSTGSEPSVAT